MTTPTKQRPTRSRIASHPTVHAALIVSSLLIAPVVAAEENAGAWTMPEGSAPQAPGSQAPGSQAPGSQAPGSQAPGSQAPGSQAPTRTAPCYGPSCNAQPAGPSSRMQVAYPPASASPLAPRADAPQADAQSPDPDAGDDEPSPVQFDLALTTYAPLSLGGQASLELPARLLVQLDLGWMPPAYGSAISGLVSRVAGYDSAIASLVDGAIDDAFVVRVSGGWRPFPGAGFEITGGYTHVRLAGAVNPADVAALLDSDAANALAAQLGDEIAVRSALHNFHVAIGWRWVVVDHLLIRANIGYTQTVSSSSSVSIPDHPELEALVNPTVGQELGAVYETYVKLPVLGLSLGYRF